MEKQSDAARFWGRVDKAGDCWEWGGSRNSKGYGQFMAGGKALRAHRFSYELANGPIPAGLVVMHSCDNRSCVNPAHLSLGTFKDNAVDMATKGRSPQQQKTHCPHGHEYTSDNTRPQKQNKGRECRECRRAGKRLAYARKTATA